MIRNRSRLVFIMLVALLCILMTGALSNNHIGHTHAWFTSSMGIPVSISAYWDEGVEITDPDGSVTVDMSVDATVSLSSSGWQTVPVQLGAINNLSAKPVNIQILLADDNDSYYYQEYYRLSASHAQGDFLSPKVLSADIPGGESWDIWVSLRVQKGGATPKDRPYRGVATINISIDSELAETLYSDVIINVLAVD